jgi:hypothetical protein
MGFVPRQRHWKSLVIFVRRVRSSAADAAQFHSASQTRVARKKRSQPWLPSLCRYRGTPSDFVGPVGLESPTYVTCRDLRVVQNERRCCQKPRRITAVSVMNAPSIASPHTRCNLRRCHPSAPRTRHRSSPAGDDPSAGSRPASRRTADRARRSVPHQHGTATQRGASRESAPHSGVDRPFVPRERSARHHAVVSGARADLGKRRGGIRT